MSINKSYKSEYPYIYIIATMLISTCLSTVSTILIHILYVSKSHFNNNDKIIIYVFMFSLTYILSISMFYVLYKTFVINKKKDIIDVKNVKDDKKDLLLNYSWNIEDPLDNI